MNAETNQENVYALYKPVHVLSNIILPTPSNLKCKSLESTVKIFWFRIWNVSFALIYCFLTYLALNDVETMHPVGSGAIMTNMDRGVIIFDLLLVLTVLKTAWEYRKLPSLILRSLNDFDYSINAYFNEFIDTNGQAKKQINTYLVHILVSLLFMISEVIYSIEYYGYIQWYTISFLIGMLLRLVMVFQYTAFLNMAYWRFKQVNSFVKNLEKQKTNEPIGKKSKLIITLSGKVESETLTSWDKAAVGKIRRDMTMLRIMHESLINVCRELVDSYGFFQAVSIITTLLEQLALSFGIFMAISHDDDVSVGFLYGTLLRSLFYMYVIGGTHYYFVFYSCDLVEKESVQTGQHVQLFFLRTEYQEQLVKNVRLFSLQLKQTELVFSAAGVFTLDWGMMSDIVSEVSSYLIFFIQSSGFTFSTVERPDFLGNKNVTDAIAELK